MGGNWNVVFEGQAGQGTDSPRLISMDEEIKFKPYGSHKFGRVMPVSKRLLTKIGI